MIDLARGDQGQAAGAVEVGPPGVEIVGADRRDAGFVAEDRAAERLLGIGGGPQIVEDDVGGRVARLAQLLQHDLLLADEVGGIEMRAQHHVGEQFDAERQMLGEQGGGEAGAVALGAGVEIAADILDRFAQFARRAPAGALEHHMLEQMGEAVDPRRLVARAGIGVEADGDGFETRHRPAGDLEAAGEGGELHHEGRDLGAQGSGGNVGA